MSWRDRAIPADEPRVEKTGWRSRAEPVVEEDPNTFEATGVDALGVGGLQGMTFGFGDEAIGGVQAALDVLKGDARFADIAERYKHHRDTAREAFGEVQKQRPKTYLAGEVVGGVATSAVPGLNAAKGANALVRTGKAVGTGAAYGYGSSDAEDLKGQLVDTALGGAGGAVGQVGGELLEKGITKLRGPSARAMVKAGDAIPSGASPTANRVADSLEDFAHNRATKQAGAMLKDYRGMKQMGTLEDTGRYLLDMGVVTPGASYDTIASRAGAIADDAGASIGALFKGLDDRFDDLATSPHFRHALPTGERVADRIEKEIINQFGDDQTMKAALGPIYEQLTQYRQLGNAPMPLGKLQNFKRNLDKFLKFDKTGSPSTEMLKDVRKIIKQEIERSVDDLAKAAGKNGDQIVDVLAQYKQAKKTYGIMKRVKDMASDRSLRDEANRFVSPSDYIAATAGFVGGGDDFEERGLTGVALLMANRVGRKYGSGVAAKMAKRLAPHLRNIPSTGRGVQRVVSKAAQAGIPAKMGAIAGERAGEEAQLAPKEIMQRIQSKGTLVKYLPVLQQAAQRGDQSFATTYYMLGQQDPAFQEAMFGEN